MNEPRVYVDVRLCLTVEQATAVLAALPDSPYSTAKGETAADTATPDQVRRQLTALVTENGMKTVRREADDLPEWEHISGADTQLVAWCRQLANRLVTDTDEGR